MPTPFPGMDPYLERAGMWEEVHTRLIVAIADALGPQVRPKHRVGVEPRTYLAVLTPDEYELVGKPDVLVAAPRHQEQPIQATTTTAGIAPKVVQLPIPEEVIERHLLLRCMPRMCSGYSNCYALRRLRPPPLKHPAF